MVDEKAQHTDKLKLEQEHSQQLKQAHKKMDSYQPSKKEMSLNQWANSLYSKDAKEAVEHMNITEKLSEFGIRTAEDLKAWFRSPAGEAVRAIIQENNAQKQAMIQEQQIQQQEQKQKKFRKIALLFMMYANRSAHADHNKIEQLIKQNEQAIERASATTPQTSGTKDQAQTHSEILDYYQAVHKTLVQEQKELDQKLVQLQKEKSALDAKYEASDAGIKEALSSIEQLSTEENAQAKDKITAKIDELEAQVASQKEEISYSSNLTDDQLKEKRNSLMSTELKKMIYKEHLSTLDGNRYYVDSTGADTNSPANARYIFPVEYKDRIIVDNNGKFLLVKAGQDLEEIKQNPSAKEAARSAFKQLKKEHQAVPVIRGVEKTKASDLKNIEDKISEVQKQRTEKLEQKRLVENQISFHQEQRSQLQSQLSQSQVANNLQPMPTSAINQGNPILQDNQPTVNQAYQNELNNLKNQHEVSKEDMRKLAEMAPENNRAEAQRYVQAEIANMPRTPNIPHQAMVSMLKNMERFSVDSTKENITNKKSPLELKDDAKEISAANNSNQLETKLKADQAKENNKQEPAPESEMRSSPKVGG